MDTIDFSKYNNKTPVLPPASTGGSNTQIDFSKYQLAKPGQSSIPTPKPTLWQKIKSAPGNFSEGVAKGELSTIQGLGQLGLKGTDALGLTKSQGNDTFFSKADTLDAKGTMQNLGKGAEQIGEFFLPESKVADAGKVIDAATEGLSKIPKIAARIGAKAAVQGVSTGAVTTAQTASPEKGGVGALFGAATAPIGEGISTLAKSALPEVADWIQKSSLRLTPVQKRDLGTKVDAVAKWLTDKNIIGTGEGRYNKVAGIYSGMEDTLQNTLKTTAKDVTVDKQSVLDKLDSLKGKYSNDRDVIGIEKQIDDAKAAIQRQPDAIPVSNLNEFKRSTFHNAYNTSGVKVLDTVEHDIGDTVYGEIKGVLKKNGVTIDGKNLEDFNKEYATVLNAKKLLKIAASRKQAGFLSKLIASGAGAALGSFLGPIGEAAGAVAAPAATEALAGAPVRSAAASGISKLGKLIPGSGKVTAPLQSSEGFFDKR